MLQAYTVQRSTCAAMGSVVGHWALAVLAHGTYDYLLFIQPLVPAATVALFIAAVVISACVDPCGTGRV